jgi:hypothetical protein
MIPEQVTPRLQVAFRLLMNDCGPVVSRIG